MGVIGGIIVFLVGTAVGLSAAAGIATLVNKLVSQYRRENKRLKESAWQDRLEFETSRA